MKETKMLNNQNEIKIDFKIRISSPLLERINPSYSSLFPDFPSNNYNAVTSHLSLKQTKIILQRDSHSPKITQILTDSIRHLPYRHQEFESGINILTFMDRKLKMQIQKNFEQFVKTKRRENLSRDEQVQSCQTIEMCSISELSSSLSRCSYDFDLQK